MDKIISDHFDECEIISIICPPKFKIRSKYNVLYGFFPNTSRIIEWKYNDNRYKHYSEEIIIFSDSVIKIDIDYSIILKTEQFVITWDTNGRLIEETYFNDEFDVLDRRITYFNGSKLIEVDGLYFIYNLKNYFDNRRNHRLKTELINLARYQNEELNKLAEGLLVNPDFGIFFYIIGDEVNAVTASVSNNIPIPKRSIEYIKKNLSRLKTEAEKLRMNPRNYILDLLGY